MIRTYRDLKERVFAIFDGEDTNTNVKKFAKEIHQAFLEKKITAGHYNELMKYLSSHYFTSRLVLNMEKERGR